MTIRDYGPYLHFMLTGLPGILDQTAVRLMCRAVEDDQVVTRFRCMKNISTLFSSWQDHVNVRCMRKIAIDLRRAGWRAGEWLLPAQGGDYWRRPAMDRRCQRCQMAVLRNPGFLRGIRSHRLEQYADSLHSACAAFIVHPLFRPENHLGAAECRDQFVCIAMPHNCIPDLRIATGMDCLGFACNGAVASRAHEIAL